MELIGCLVKTENLSLFCKLRGLNTKTDAKILMNQLCSPPTPTCPSTDSILQLDIILPHRQEEEEDKKTAEVGRQTKQRQKRKSQEEVGCTVSALKAEEEKVTAARTWLLVR